jgi:hypothetical protein
VVTYVNGPATEIGHRAQVRFDGYRINGIELRGVYSSELTQRTTAQFKYEVTLEKGEAFWNSSDEKIERNASLEKTWKLGASQELLITGTADGLTKKGEHFTMRILEPVVFKDECRISERLSVAVQGVKVFSNQGKNIFIDYGNGNCDVGIAVTVNGNTRNVNIY